MERLAYPFHQVDGRRTMRSIADAIETMRELKSWRVDDTIEIALFPMELFDGRRTGVITVAQRRAGQIVVTVEMPPSGEFTALTSLGERMSFPIGALRQARCDSDGTVTLASGQVVHGLNFRPVPFYAFTDTDLEITRYAVKVLGAKAACYRQLAPVFSPGLYGLDFSLVTRVRITKLKPLVHQIIKRYPNQTYDSIVSVLTRAGMQFPRSRRRDHNLATQEH